MDLIFTFLFSQMVNIVSTYYNNQALKLHKSTAYCEIGETFVS